MSFFGTTPAWNVTGQPAMTVPAGFAPNGLPIGVQLVARPHEEPTILGLAAQLEECNPPWPPAFAPAER